MGANKHKSGRKRHLGKHFRPNIKKLPPRHLKPCPFDPKERDMPEKNLSLVLRFLRVKESFPWRITTMW